VLSVIVHDDDLTYYELWNIGERRDTYNSMPGWPEWRGPPEGGNTAELVRLMGRDECDAAIVERILRAEHGIEPSHYLFEYERHKALTAALGLPQYSAGFGYRYLATSISAGEPLSTEFESTGVPYQDPFDPSVLSELLANARVPTEDEAEAVIDVTPDTILWRRRGQESHVAVDPDVGTQLREADIPTSAMVMLRGTADTRYERVGAVMKSLRRAGFITVIFGSASKR
jgi:hypothetical protein